jgi:hypothetical protein
MTDDARTAISELLDLRGQPITLIPGKGVVTEKPSGGRDYGPAAPRDPQIFAMFQVSSAKTGRYGKGFDAAEAGSDGGTVRKFVFNMIGGFDAVVAIGDTWEDDLAKYQVESVDYAVPYQVGAVVSAFLKVPGQPGHGNALPFGLPVTWSADG